MQVYAYLERESSIFNLLVLLWTMDERMKREYLELNILKEWRILVEMIILGQLLLLIQIGLTAVGVKAYVLTLGI